MNQRANFPLFSDSAFDRWVHLTGEVLRAVLAIHLMKYPVGLQVMPLSDKLGLNVPKGGLVEPHVRDRFRRFLEPAVRDRLQAQSDADPEATALRDQLNALPDLTDGEWRQQIREQDEMLIASSGFENWVSGHEAMRHHRTPEEQVDADIYQQEMRSWAEAHEALTLEQIFSRNQAGNNPV